MAANSLRRMSLLVPSMGAVVTTTAISYKTYFQKSECEAKAVKSKNAPPPVRLKSRMTAIGRFSLKSETIQNPSIPTFFVALSSNTKQGMTIPEFEALWNQTKMFQNHPRFGYRVVVSDDDDHHTFESLHEIDGEHLEPSTDPIRRYMKETLHYSVYRKDLTKRICHYLTSPLDVTKQLWQVQISSGALGSSGAISHANAKRIQLKEGEMLETVLLFRAHHSMADGVSLISAMSDLSDEAPLLQKQIHDEISKRKHFVKQLSFWQKCLLYLKKILGYWMFGSLRALLYQTFLLITTPNHPFAHVLTEDFEKETRSVSWCDVAPVTEVKTVAKALYGKATVNDLFVACITSATRRLLEYHYKHGMITDSIPPPIPSSINVVLPVHLTGGILLPNQSMGNRIGASVIKIPFLSSLECTSDSIRDIVKNTPSSVISYFMAKVSSHCLPDAWTQFFMERANANAAVVISNVRGPSFKLHWDGRAIESMAGFVPIPPGVPIGVVVQSYADTITLSITADSRVVPDADMFLGWVLEEYQMLCEDARKKGVA